MKVINHIIGSCNLTNFHFSVPRKCLPKQKNVAPKEEYVFTFYDDKFEKH